MLQIAGSSKVLQALVGGSADVGGGVYEQTIQMAAEGRDIVSFASLLRSPNFALAVAPGHASRTMADLRGTIAGVSSRGSPSQVYLNQLLLGSRVAPARVRRVGVRTVANTAAA